MVEEVKKMNYQNQNAFQSLSNNQNPNNQALGSQSLSNQAMNNQGYNQTMNNQDYSQALNNQSLSTQNLSNQSSANQALSNQAQLQNESSLAASGYNPQQDLEMAAEFNQKTPGEISRILASQSMTGIEFGYLPNAAQMNNMTGMNNLNNSNNMNNANAGNLKNNMR
jgi:hypothetical protein